MFKTKVFQHIRSYSCRLQYLFGRSVIALKTFEKRFCVCTGSSSRHFLISITFSEREPFCLIDESCKWVSSTHRKDLWSILYETPEFLKDIHYRELTIQHCVDKCTWKLRKNLQNERSSYFDVMRCRRRPAYILTACFFATVETM